MKWSEEIPDTEMDTVIKEWKLSGGTVEKYGNRSIENPLVYFKYRGSTRAAYIHRYMRSVWVRTYFAVA